MNKKILLVFPLLISLTACSFNMRSILKTNSGPGNGNGNAMELPTQTKLALGIINLEETENAVTAEQAKELLPMFHVLKDLDASDTAAQEEVNGLVDQIQSTLTDKQTQAIDAMSLSMRDVFSVVQGGSGKSSATTSSSTSGSSGNGGGMGGPPDMGGGGSSGGMPGGGGGMPGGLGTSSSSSSSSSKDTGTTVTTTSSTPSALLDAVIKVLEKKQQ